METSCLVRINDSSVKEKKKPLGHHICVININLCVYVLSDYPTPVLTSTIVSFDLQAF